jgi:hypothetical protein
VSARLTSLTMFGPPGAADPPLDDAADRHVAAALPHVADDDMGEHWLVSFALPALTE